MESLQRGRNLEFKETLLKSVSVHSRPVAGDLAGSLPMSRTRQEPGKLGLGSRRGLLNGFGIKDAELGFTGLELRVLGTVQRTCF